MDAGGTGGAGTGGAGGAGADGGLACSATFVSPADGATLNEANGGGVGMCSTDGFQATITVATNQPDGTTASLSVGNGPLVTAKVSGSTVTFSKIVLPQQSNLPLKVSFSTTCSTSIKVNVDCSLPACSITAPVLTPVHPALNGVPAISGGDRASASGAAYQVAFKVKTDIEDGKDVRLVVTNNDVSGQQVILTAKAAAGFAPFPGVTLVPDGVYDVRAFCKNAAGIEGSSTSPAPYPVDTTGPDLTISSPASGTFMGPLMLTNGAFKVCAKTASADAAGLAEALGAAAKNLCVSVGSGACANPVAVAAVGTDTCVDIACPGSAPFDINVTLTDAAGNPAKKTITNIACASTLPGVQIISPSSDDSTPAFSDATKRLLSATSTNTFKDQAPATLGAQWDVVACTNTLGTATLYGGQKDGTLTALGTPVTTVAAVAADNCPGGSLFVAKFPAATLPQSMEDGTGALVTPTELRVDVQDQTTAVGKSPSVNIWVDSEAPTVAFAPPSICNTTVQSATDKMQDLFLSTTTDSLTLTVTSGSGAVNYSPSSYVGGLLRFNSVVLPLGQDTLTGTIADTAGNSSSLAQPCVVTVGTPPIITLQSPSTFQNLCASTTASASCVADTDATTAGWQGTLTVLVTVNGAPVTSGTVAFTTAPGGDLGTATIDGTGHAILPVTIADGQVTLSLETSAMGSNGKGTLSRSLVVDTVLPGAPVALGAAFKDRRQTSYTLSWMAPADVGGSVVGYDIRFSTSPITEGNFGAASTVADSGSPHAAGQAETRVVSDLYIEKQYYFAVAARDGSGNRSAISTYTPSSTETAHFQKTTLLGPLDGTATSGFGATIDGVDDFTSDGKTDLIVTERSTRRVFVYGAGSDPLVDGGPAITLSGTAGTFFGASAVSVGDIDGDGKPDLAVSAPRRGNGVIDLYFGGSSSWIGAGAPANDQVVDAVITADDPAFGSVLFGYPLTRLGDVNGDGLDDFAASVWGLNANRGRVLIVLGKKPFTSFAISDTTRVLTIEGEAASTGRFGSAVVGMGAKNGTVFISAPKFGGTGKIYAFKYDANSNSMVAAGTPMLGTSGSFGTSLFLLGPNGGLLSANPVQKVQTSAGVADVFFGSTTANPFGTPRATFLDNAAAGASDNFGRVLAGGGFSGTTYQVSLIGSDKTTPDILAAPNAQGGGSSRLFIVDGSKASSLPSPVDLSLSADVGFTPFPSDWAGLSPTSAVVRDFDGDGYGDIVVGELNGTTPTSIRGRVLVLW